MLTVEVVPAESARYAAALLVVPGLWAGTRGWRGFSTYLAHRGWECHLLDVHGRGGVAARAAEVTDYAASLPARPVLLAHDAGAAVALAAAAPAHALAIVLMAPLVPGGAEIRALIRGFGPLVAVLLGRPVAPPVGAAAALLWGALPETVRAQVAEGSAAEDAAFVRDLLRSRTRTANPSGTPLLLLAGDSDPLLSRATAATTASALHAEQQTLPGVGHWPHVEPTWKQTVGLLHRWLVQRLGEPLLDFYAEAMAERDAEDGE